MEKDLKWIKKHYGETMMHLCRSLFPQILEKENILPMLLEEHFPHSRLLAKDIIEQERQNEFKDFIFSLIDVEKKEKVDNSKKSAVQLMREAGYILYPECKSEREIQSFKKFWAPREELCTFRGGRLKTCRVWFALKDNIENIKRKDFKNPQRQDEYGTSAISIQFSRGKNSTLSIKNRYNHTVNNPDNTFNSDLDNIVSGLTDAFERDYGVRDSQASHNRLELENYICLNGKYYHYNYEINNIFYCDNNVIIDNFEVKHLPQSKMLIDYYVFDTSSKEIYLYDDNINDCFPETIGEIKQLTNSSDEIYIKVNGGEDIKIGLDNRRRMIYLENQNLKKCGNDFLCYDEAIEKLCLPNLVDCGNNFCSYNNNLKKLELPSLEKCGDAFIYENTKINNIHLPNLRKCGSDFLYKNKKIEELDLPKLEECGDSFIRSGGNISYLNIPRLRKCGNEFLYQNAILKQLNLLSLKEAGDFFLHWDNKIQSVNLPNLEKCGKRFLFSARPEDLYAPLLKICGSGFLHNAQDLTCLDLPNLEECGDEFLRYSGKITDVKLPSLRRCGNKFLFYNDGLASLEIPNLEKCGDDFLSGASHLSSLNLPKLNECGSNFILGNQKLSKLKLLNLTRCGDNFLPNNKKAMKVYLPSLKEHGDNFLQNISKKSELYCPNLSNENIKCIQKNTEEERSQKNSLKDFFERIIGRER